MNTNQKANAAMILGTIKFDRGFHFTTKNGVYTGLTATSLQDFVDKLKIVDSESILFHYSRGDFQKWIDDTLKDTELANRMCFIQTGLKAEQLRQQLLKMVQTRINELKGPWLDQSTNIA